MRFVQNFTRPDFQAKAFTLSISPYLNSFSDKTQKMSENVTLPPAVTNLTSVTCRKVTWAYWMARPQQINLNEKKTGSML